MNQSHCPHCEILAVRARWTQGLDSCDWSLLRSTITDFVFVDYSGWNHEPGTMQDADTWVERRKGLFPGLWASQHSISNAIINVSANQASARMYVTAEHVLAEDGERWFTLGGIYEDEYTLAEGSWRISAMKLTPRWFRGDRDVLTQARHLAATGTGPRSA
jgi:hypothetical protein